MVEHARFQKPFVRWVEGRRGETLDARVDVFERSVILHSRGGATGGRPARNTQYEAALREICRRGTAGMNAFERILIDSAPARRLPEDERVLLLESEIVAFDADQLVAAIRSRLRTFGQPEQVTGGNSTKRVRFDLKYSTAPQLLRLRKDPPARVAEQKTRSRLSADQLRRVTVDHVGVAVARLLAGEEASNFAPSRDYDLIADDGTRLAPKQVFGFALEAALNIEAFPQHFSAGWGTPCFDILKAAGYSIVVKGGDDPREVAAILNDIDDDEARSFVEGSKSRALHLKRERNRALVVAFKSDFLDRHGRFYCEKCGEDWVSEYGDKVASACFEAHHAIMQVSEMEEGHESTIADLQLLCANCHRVEHRCIKLGIARAFAYKP